MVYRQSQRKATVAPPPKQAGAPSFTRLEIAPIEALCGAGRLLSQITLPPGAVIEAHSHQDEYEFYLILSGEGDYHYNDTVAKLYPGDVTYCPNGEKHGLVNTGSGDLSLVAFIGFPNPERQ